MATALLLVDVQRHMLTGSGPVPSAADVTTALAGLVERARAAAAVVVHVQHDGDPGTPDEVGTPGWELFFPPTPDELVFHKSIGNAFEANPDLAGTLVEHGVDRVVVAGMQSEFCIAAASRSALDLGFAVVLAAGAHATFDDAGHSAAEWSIAAEADLAAAGVDLIPAAAIDF